MPKSRLQKFKDILDLPGTLGIGMTLLEILILGIVFGLSHKEEIPESVIISFDRPSAIAPKDTVNVLAESKRAIHFQHESDVHNYLRNHNFINREGDISITEGSGMTLVANGTILTGAIYIQRFTAQRAYFTAHSPISGVTNRFWVDCEQGVLHCLNDRTDYYVQ